MLTLEEEQKENEKASGKSKNNILQNKSLQDISDAMGKQK
jgi:hypothetical protein